MGQEVASDKEPHIWPFWVAVHTGRDHKPHDSKVPFLMRRLNYGVGGAVFVSNGVGKGRELHENAYLIGNHSSKGPEGYNYWSPPSFH